MRCNRNARLHDSVTAGYLYHDSVTAGYLYHELKGRSFMILPYPRRQTRSNISINIYMDVIYGIIWCYRNARLQGSVTARYLYRELKRDISNDTTVSPLTNPLRYAYLPTHI